MNTNQRDRYFRLKCKNQTFEWKLVLMYHMSKKERKEKRKVLINKIFIQWSTNDEFVLMDIQKFEIKVLKIAIVR